MEPLKDAISVRVTRLNNQLQSKNKDKCALLTREGLFDALQLLYEECNNESLKNTDKNIAGFVDKYRKHLLELKKLRVNLGDFEVKNVIGRGHFGEVHVVKERQTGDVYAMKTVRKYENSDKKSTIFAEERDIMVQASSPWITHLQYAFQDANNLYFIMEYHAGGDLLGLLFRQGGTIPESAATFYLAELILAINDVHNMGYIHRDIKPDNILLDRCGHLKLADFGSAAKINSHGLVSGGIPVGTPDYIAPEALQSLDNKTKKANGSYGKECDFWSFGIVAYEMTIGTTPFNGTNTSATYSKIMNHAKSLKFPPDLSLSQAYVNLIKCLLIDRNVRLGYDRIVKHSLFKNVDFLKIRDQVPPFVPIISGVDDTSNFADVQKKKKEPIIENFKTRSQFSGRNLPFLGFTYTLEPTEAKEQFCSSVLVKDDQSERLKGEIENLHKKLMKFEGLTQDKEAVERKIEEKMRKLESVESVRDKLERELANNISECQALKRTLDFERKERSDLERKALELFKSSKLNWETSQKLKLDSINKELTEAKDKNNQLSQEVENLNHQLQCVLEKSKKQMASIESVEKMRRSSVVGLESRLERVTSETQEKISILQSRLSDEVEKTRRFEKQLLEIEKNHSELANQYEITAKENGELKNKCRESDRIINTLKQEVSKLEEKSEDLEFHKAMVKSLEEDIEDLKGNNAMQHELRKELEQNNVLKKQVKDLKTELNSIRSSKLSSLDDLKGRHEAEVTKYEGELKKLKEEKTEYEMQLKEANLSLQSKEDKAHQLEGLLNQLQSDLSKLETGSEREGVLQEQIERLEQQLVDVSANAAVEKQEVTEVKLKLWRVEKELSNATLDKKIIERDLKEEQFKNKQLMADIKVFEDKIEEMQKTSEKQTSEFSAKNDQLSIDLQRARNDVERLQIRLEEQKNKENASTKNFENMKINLEANEQKICMLLDVIDSLKCEKLVLEQKFTDRDDEKTEFINHIIEKDQELASIKLQVEKLNAEYENSLLNRKALREACTVLEIQLIEFETILESSESKRHEMQSEISQLQNEITKYKTNLSVARREYNEEKSYKLLGETKVKRLMEDIDFQQKEIHSLKMENGEFKQYSNELSKELSALEAKINDQNLTIKSLERQLDEFVAENNYLKEENSEQITFINSIKESNYALNQHLSEAQSNIIALTDKIRELDMILNEKTQFFNERELKADSVIHQQTKLIDYLQSKVEESSKKKRTLSDKLFGHSKKENVPPVSIALNYKDLESQLAKEKEQNKSLHQEIIKLKAAMYNKCEGDFQSTALLNLQMQDDILAQIVHSPSSQKNDLYRQNSVQRMHHNIPHRFDSKLCTKASKCAQCNNQILLGRYMSVCRECHLATHQNCASLLPKTCGLPVEYAMHYSESLNKIHSSSSISISDMGKTEEINIEGWVKIPTTQAGWQKHYACLTTSTLCIYPEPPNNSGVKAIQSLKLVSSKEKGKVILEPVHSEIPIPVANSDLPFVIKVETSPNSTCWPSQCIIFMTLSTDDKEKWHNALQNIFKCNDKAVDVLLYDTEDLQINCIVELNKQIKVLGTDSGLHTLQKYKCMRIMGLEPVYEIVVLEKINMCIMIADEKRTLAVCDLKHLITLCECAPCSKPVLKPKTLSINNMDGFLMLRASNFERNKFICAATSKKLAIFKFDSIKNEFVPQRILDTAQPASCILFTEHSLIIGADKFFEIDLVSYEADEFLDASDSKLSQAVRCFQMKSFPLSIQYIAKAPQPIEYLVCFSEFATFVDEYGRSTRKNDLSWTYLPLGFYYAKRYLYVLQFNAVEIYKLTPSTCNGNENEALQLVKIDMPNAQYLGENENGIYLHTGKQIKYIDAHHFDDSLSVSTEATNNDVMDSDRFSFTSSMIDGSLDVNSIKDEVIYENQRRIKFTDL